MKTLQSIDTKFRGGADENVTEKLNKENQQEFEIEEVLEVAPEKPEVVFEEDEETEKGFDVANYTRSIQIASEAKTGVKFNGAEKARADYDGRDNNPADVMAGWDDFNETIPDYEQRERNLQYLVDEKGYHTPEIEEALEQELERE